MDYVFRVPLRLASGVIMMIAYGGGFAWAQSDDCATATVVGIGSHSGDTSAAANDGSASCGDSATSGDLWYRFTPTEDCLLFLDTCGGTDWDTVLSVHTSCPGVPGNELSCNDDACAVQSRLGVSVTNGTTYWIRVAGWQGATGAYTMDLNCPAGGGAGADVFLGELSVLEQFGREGDEIGCAIDTPLCNAGLEPLDWYANPDPRHPFMVYNLYRLQGSRFEQIGQSWVKHGFGAAQENTCGLGCIPHPDGTRLGVGCSDTYGASLNAFQPGLGPRREINPWTGAYSFAGSLLENDPGAVDDVDRRLRVHDADLDPVQNPGASYLAEVYILAHDDADHLNSVAWEPVLLSGSPGGTWAFDIGASDTRIGPAIEGWPGALRTTIPSQPTDDGRCILGVRTSDNGNGTWHYEYVLYNHDMDRQVGAFIVPVAVSTTVTNVGFHAVESNNEGYSNAPWTWTRAGGSMAWATEAHSVNPTANSLRWGTAYSFRFDADAAPVNTTVTLGLFKPGTPAALSGATLGPTGPASIPAISGTGLMILIGLVMLCGAFVLGRSPTAEIEQPNEK